MKNVMKFTIKNLDIAVENDPMSSVKLEELNIHLEHEVSAQELTVIYDKLPRVIEKVYDMLVDAVKRFN